MRECPTWFQEELTRIGGANQYGEPIFRLVWSTLEFTFAGGLWAQTGYVGYKRIPAVPGTPCWALMMWEPAEVFAGPYEAFMRDYRDEETGLMQCGGYPKYGGYRVLQKFLHREIVRQPMERHYMHKGEPHIEVLQHQELRTYRLEPCGLILDLLLPMLRSWLRLSLAQRVQVLRQREQMKKDKMLRMAKDAREGTRLGRVMRGSKLVQKRAEIIEQGMRQAMARAVQWGLGIRLEAETWQQ